MGLERRFGAHDVGVVHPMPTLMLPWVCPYRSAWTTTCAPSWRPRPARGGSGWRACCAISPPTVARAARRERIRAARAAVGARVAAAPEGWAFYAGRLRMVQVHPERKTPQLDFPHFGLHGGQIPRMVWPASGGCPFAVGTMKNSARRHGTPAGMAIAVPPVASHRGNGSDFAGR